MSEVRRTAAEAAAPDNVIAFQGALGAYSDMACREARPQMTTLPCASFEDTFAAVRDERARYAMIPIENSSAGREVGRAHVCTPVTNAQLVCRILLEKKNAYTH